MHGLMVAFVVRGCSFSAERLEIGGDGTRFTEFGIWPMLPPWTNPLTPKAAAIP